MSKATQTPIAVGGVVEYNGGWYRVTAMTKNTVNLGSVFGRHIYHKRVPITEVREDHEAWYRNWSQSESYQCM